METFPSAKMRFRILDIIVHQMETDLGSETVTGALHDPRRAFIAVARALSSLLLIGLVLLLFIIQNMGGL